MLKKHLKSCALLLLLGPLLSLSFLHQALLKSLLSLSFLHQALLKVSPASSSQLSPPSSGKVQYGLGKFFGSSAEKESAKPVTRQWTEPYKKRKLSKFAADALKERNEWAEMAAKLAAEQAEDEEALVAAAELPRKKMQQAGRPKKVTRRSNSDSGQVEQEASWLSNSQSGSVSFTEAEVC